MNNTPSWEVEIDEAMVVVEGLPDLSSQHVALDTWALPGASSSSLAVGIILSG